MLAHRNANRAPVLALPIVLAFLLACAGIPYTLSPQPAPNVELASPVPVENLPTATFTAEPTPIVPATRTPQRINPFNGATLETSGRLGKGNLNHFDVSPDGSGLAIAASTGIYLYDTATLAEQRYLETDEWIGCLAYSPDGTRLATWQADGLVKIWDLASGAEAFTLGSPQGSRLIADGLRTLAWTPDGASLIAIGVDGSIQFWDTASRASTRSLGGDSETLFSTLALSPDGTRLAAVSLLEGRLRVWDAVSGVELEGLDLPEAFFSGLAFSPDGSSLVVTTMGFDEDFEPTGRLVVRDIASGQVRFEQEGLPGFGTPAVFAPGGATFSAALGDTTFATWESAGGTQVSLSPAINEVASAAAYLPGSQLLAASFFDGTLRLFETGTWSEVGRIEGFGRHINDMALSPDGSLLATASFNGSVSLWDLAGNAEIARWPAPEAWAESLAISPDGDVLVAGYNDGRLRFWDLSTRTELRTVTSEQHFLENLAFTPDGAWLLTGGNDGRVEIREASSGELARTLEGPDESLSGLAVSPDGSLVFAGFQDGTVVIWEAASGTERHREEVFGFNLMGAFSPWGTYLAIGDSGGEVFLRDGRTWAALAQLGDIGLGIETVAFSSDESLLATGGGDRTVTLWDLASRTQVAILSGHTQTVTRLLFTPDGMTLLSASEDGTVRAWRTAR